MEDRRIKKTKRALKNTLIEMMTELPFEQISITALCDRAEISRITFIHIIMTNTHSSTTFFKI